MEKYIQLAQELYTEPKDEDILGSFWQVETTGTDDVAKVPRAVYETKKRKNKSEVQTKDIRIFFERNSKQTTHHLHKRAHSDQTNIKRKSSSFGLNWLCEKHVIFERNTCQRHRYQIVLRCLELNKKKLLQISENW